METHTFLPYLSIDASVVHLPWFYIFKLQNEYSSFIFQRSKLQLFLKTFRFYRLRSTQHLITVVNNVSGMQLNSMPRK